MFQIIKPDTKIDFVSKIKVFYTVSILLCIVSLALVFLKGFIYGVDFSGGTSIQVTFEKAVPVEEMRSVLSGAVQGSISIQTVGGDNTFQIKIEQTEDENLKKVADDLQNILSTRFVQYGKLTVDSIDQVGPQVGKDLKRQAIFAVIYALIGILIYIAVRFELLSATGSVLALVHDVILTLGIIVALGLTFDLTVLAALLTVVGYSLNDKIVIFDRIRERRKADSDKPYGESMNKSINETLSRTVLTSASTLLAVISLAVFGGEVIRAFAIVMIAGVIIGTYSSIGIASSLVYSFKNLKNSKKAVA